MSSWLRRIGGPNSLTLTAWLLLIPFSLAIILLLIPEDSSVSIWLWLLLGVASHLMLGFAMLLGNLALRPFDLGARPRPYLALTIFVMAGFLRGLVTSNGTVWIGAAAAPEYQQRMLASILITTVWLSITAVIVDYLREFRATAAELRVLTEDQEQLLKANQTTISAQRLRIQNRIEELIGLEFNRKLDHSEVERVVLAGRLHQITDTAIRPFAHDLAREGELILLREAPLPRRPISLAPVLKTLVGQAAFQPGPTTFAVVLFTLGAKTALLGAAGLVSVALSAVLSFGLLWLAMSANRSWQPFSSLPRPIGVLALVASWLAIGAIDAIVTLALWPKLAEQVQQAGVSISLTSGFAMLLVATAAALRIEAEASLDALSQAAIETTWAAARSRQLLWVEQQRLARLIHSEVQARIRAAALRLQLSVDAGDDLEQMLTELRAAIRAGIHGEQSSTSLSDLLTEIAEIWEDTIELSHDLSASLQALIEADSATHQAVRSILQEAVLNASKHASASKVRISFTLITDLQARADLLQVSAIDNGFGIASELTDDDQHSFGSQLLDEVSHSWSLERHSEETVLTALLPIQLAQELSSTTTGT